MTETINILKNQIERIGSVIEGLEDKSRIAHPAEYDFGASLLDDIVSDLRKVKGKIANPGHQNWFLNRR